MTNEKVLGIHDHLFSSGEDASYEGHDVLKFNNKVTVYNKILEFFKEHLKL